MGTEIQPSVPVNTALDEAKEESLDELMSRDPLSLSDQDVDKIISAYRAERRQWAKEDSARASAPKSSRTAGPKPTITDLKLGDLGL